MRTTLILADAVVALDAGDTIHRPGYVAVADERIVGIGPRAALGGSLSFTPDGLPVDEIVDLQGHLVMPGLVNAHAHTPMVLFRGLAEAYSLFTWEGWYNGIRVWEEVMDGGMVPPAVAVSCAEMIRTGTTCFADQYFYMDRVTPVVRQSGLRACLAYGIVEMGDAGAREREIASATTFLESVQGDGRIKGWIGPHAFFVDNSPEAIELELALADRFDAGLHIHLATSGEEERHCQATYGRSAVQQMALLGILDRPLLAAHSITIPEEDFPTLAAHPFTAVIAGSACMRSGAGIAAVRGMRDVGVNTALGTDNVANNNSYDLFNEMQTTAKLAAQREQTPNVVKAREILEMATAGGALALGLDSQIGSLEVGKLADLISLDLKEIGWGPAGGQDLYTALVYSVNGSYVRDVMVDGQWLFRDGAWTTLDYQGACRELDAACRELMARRKS